MDLSDTFFTNISNSNPYNANHLQNSIKYSINRLENATDYGRVVVKIPKNIYDNLVNSGLLLNKPQETKIFVGEAIEIINKYIVK